MNNSNYRRSFIDILSDTFTSMSPGGVIPGPYQGPSMIIYMVTGPAHGPWVLFVEDMYYTAVNQILTIGGHGYTVSSLSDNPSNHQITVTDPSGSLPAPAAGTFTLYPFYFFHGTPVDTASELKNEAQAANKYPMVWLWEEFEEDMDWDEGSAIDRKVNCKLFYLDQADITMGPNDSRWEAYIKPMYKFRDWVMTNLRMQRMDFLVWDQHTKDKPKSKFGVWMAAKGMEKSIFADNLAGIETSGIFTIMKNAQSFGTTFP